MQALDFGDRSGLRYFPGEQQLYYCCSDGMSKKSTSSRNSFYEERLKSCFSKKSARLPDNGPYELPYQKQSKSKTITKKPSITQKKQPREKPPQVTEEPIKTSSSSDNKNSSSGTEGNITEDSVKQVQDIPIPNQVKESFEKREVTKDEMVVNCNLGPLKTMICQKLNDCDFFSGEENIKNSSKRLLFLQYKEKELYINKSREKSRVKDKTIPKGVEQAFESVKSPKNYFAINTRIPTEETYDTSDPSNYSKMTPPGLTPRSNEEVEQTHNRRSSFSFGAMQVQKQEQKLKEAGMFFQPQPFYYYGGFGAHQSMDYTSDTRKKRAISDDDSRDYIVDPSKIQSDGRTTLMIKNIPNKYTREMLIDLFDRTHKKKYDFLYLPIDPSNSCNIGYAFINFLGCKYIRQFYQIFNGQKWEKFNSEKICRLTYARLQGTSSLVQHLEATNSRQRKIKNVDEMNFSNLSNILEKQRQDQSE